MAKPKIRKIFFRFPSFFFIKKGIFLFNGPNMLLDLYKIYFGIHIARPKTVTITYIVLFSHLTVQLPSVELSQKHELAE